MPSRIEVSECLLERLARSYGFVLIRDGSLRRDFPNAGKPTFYTRVYRLKLDGEFVNTYLRFKYDLRTGWADIDIGLSDFKEFIEQAERREHGHGDKELADEESDRVLPEPDNGGQHQPVT